MSEKATYKVIIPKGLFTDEVTVNAELGWQEGVNHLEFIGKATSETGYYSHFFFDEALKGSLEEYIREVVKDLSGLDVESVTKIV